MVRNQPDNSGNTRDEDSIHGSGRCPGGGLEDALEEAWQPTPVFLPGESSLTEEPDGLQSMGLQRVGND